MVTGSIQSKKGRLYAVLYIPTGNGHVKQKWVAMGLDTTAGKKVRQNRLDELRLEYSNIINIESVEILFCDYIRKWNEENKANISITTYDGYCHMIEKYMYPYFKEKCISLAELRPIDIESYYQYLQNTCELSGNTALKHHQIIHTSLKYAVINRLLPSNPCESVRRPKKEKTTHDFYNIDELSELMKAFKNDPLETVVYIAVWFGLRREEVLGLKWSNIDIDNNTIHICETVVRAKDNGRIVSVSRNRTKTDSSNRVLAMSDSIRQYFLNIRQKQEKQKNLCGDSYTESDYVCVDALGNPIKPDYVTQRFSKVLKKQGLRHIKFHDLRHSTASYMLSQGYSMKEVQEYLGHSNYNFTADTYVHVDNSAKFSMAQSISDDLGAD